ncbi:MAG TPA: metal ABC transporter substrate-binding protein [Fimbriimonadaceae bacterium]|nr:metal ABC transporter substrate-binding protein [Fimbriimonadaceae bacterium]
MLSTALAALGLLAPAAPLKIITTTSDLASIAAAVGGNRVTASSIITGARDPHRIEARPSFMSRSSSADLWIAVGLDLEVGYESAIIEGSRNRKIRRGSSGHLYVGELGYILDKPTGPVSRAHGDIHPQGNPHVWLDPWNGRQIAGGIAARLIQLDAAGAGDYRRNLAAFERRLDSAMFGPELVERIGGDTLWEWQRSGVLRQRLADRGQLTALGGWVASLQPFNGRPIVTYHRSLSYFAHRFGLRVVGELEPKPGIEPTPGHLASLLRHAQSSGVRAIIQEGFFPDRHAKFVAGRIGGVVVKIPQSVGHEAAAKDYISLIDTIVSRISGALRG